MPMEKSSSSAEQNAEWIVKRAKQCVDAGNTFAAKSWLLTAKTLFSGSFTVQYEAFQLERSAGRVRESGKIFFEMMHMFPKNVILREELRKIVQCQDMKPSDPETKFSKDMFESLPNTYQKELLTKYAESQHNLIERCRISLLVLKRFHGAAKEQGQRLIDTLMDAEKSEEMKTPLNIYRKAIVVDVLPLLLKSGDVHTSHSSHKQKASSLSISEPHLLTWFSLSIEFCICYAVHCAGLKLPNTDDDKTKALLRDLSISLNQSPWQLLHDQLITFAGKLSWSHILKIKDKIDPSKNRSLRSKLKALSNVKESKTSLGVFYGVLSLYFYCVIEYCSFVCGGSLPATHSSVSQPLMLVEDVNSNMAKTNPQQLSKPPKKKKRTDGGQSASNTDGDEVMVSIAPGLACTSTVQIGDCLKVAVDCLHLLTTHPVFQPEFSQIFTDWQLVTWRWTDTFNADSFLFEGKHDVCLDTIKNKDGNADSASYQVLVKENIQQASCLFCMNENQLACELAVAAVKMFPDDVISSGGSLLDSRSQYHNDNITGRHLLVLPCVYSEVLTYAVDIIVSVLKGKLRDGSTNEDSVIGHMIVLLQLDWLKNKAYFHQLIEKIVVNGSFSYPVFFKYVTNIDVLEEFAYLKNVGEVKLNLFPSQTGSVGRRTITRGVNKGATEDFLAALDKQVALEHTPVHITVGQFLTIEADSIIHC